MKANVNGRFWYEASDWKDFRVRDLGNDRFEVEYLSEIVEFEVLNKDIRDKSIELAANGLVLRVRLEEDLDEVIRLVRQRSATAVDHQVVVAPIPGVIKLIHKEEGGPVNSNDPILILEAMKMENSIQAPMDADNIEVHVRIGDRVTRGQPLFTLL